jgi:hypothetical protein
MPYLAKGFEKKKVGSGESVLGALLDLVGKNSSIMLNIILQKNKFKNLRKLHFTIKNINKKLEKRTTYHANLSFRIEGL